MRSAGQLQAFGYKEELQTKEATGQHAATPRGGHLVPATLPADQQTHQQRRYTGAQRGLHDGRDVGCCNFDDDLLHAPDQA